MGACCGYIKGNDPTKAELVILDLNRIEKFGDSKDELNTKNSLMNISGKETYTKNESSTADKETKESNYNMINTLGKDVPEDNLKKNNKKPDLKLKVEEEQSKKDFKEEIEKTKKMLLNPETQVNTEKRKSRTATQIAPTQIDLNKKPAPLDKKGLELEKLKNLPEIKLEDIKLKSSTKQQQNSNEVTLPLKRSYTVACDSEDATMTIHEEISMHTHNKQGNAVESKTELDKEKEKEKETENIKKQIENLKKQGTGTFAGGEKAEEEKDNDNDTKYSQVSPRKSLLKRCKTIGGNEKKEKSKKKVKFVGLENKQKKKRSLSKRR